MKVALNNGASIMITVLSAISLVANAPIPPFSDFRASKYSVVKRGSEDGRVKFSEERIRVGGEDEAKAGVEEMAECLEGEDGKEVEICGGIEIEVRKARRAFGVEIEAECGLGLPSITAARGPSTVPEPT